MADLVQSSEIEEVVKLLVHYSFDLGGESIAQLLERWLKSYPFRWLRPAIIEALYQGRYKSVSVEQIMMLWIRRGQPLFHFNSEFERIVGQRFPNPSRLALKQQPQWSLPASPKANLIKPQPASVRPGTPPKIQPYSTSPSSSPSDQRLSQSQASQSRSQASQTKTIPTVASSHSPVLPYSVLISKRIDQVSSASQSLGMSEERSPVPSSDSISLGSNADESQADGSASERTFHQPDLGEQSVNQAGEQNATNAELAPTHDEPLKAAEDSDLDLEEVHHISRGQEGSIDDASQSDQKTAIAPTEPGTSSEDQTPETSPGDRSASSAAVVPDSALDPTPLAIAPESSERSEANHQSQGLSHDPEPSQETHPSTSSIAFPTRDLTTRTEGKSEQQAEYPKPPPIQLSDDPQPTSKPLGHQPLGHQTQHNPQSTFPTSMVLKEKTDPIARFVPKGQASQLYSKLRSVIQKPDPEPGLSSAKSSPHLPSLVEAIAKPASDRPAHDPSSSP